MKTRIITLLAGILLAFALVIGLPMLFTDVDAAAASSITINGVTVANGKYLRSGGSSVSSSKPTGGYAYYNNGVLTLEDFKMTSSTNVIKSTGDLTITLVSDNTLTENGTDCAINVSGSLTINGTGSLTVTGSSQSSTSAIHGGNITITSGTVNSTSTKSSAFYSSGNFTVSGGTVTATTSGANHSAITAQNNISISGGTVTANATGTGSSGIKAYGSIEITGGTIKANGVNTGMYASSDIAIRGGNVSMIGQTYGLWMNSGSLTVTSGTVSSMAKSYAIRVFTDMTVSGGTITAGSTTTTNSAIYIGGSLTMSRGTLDVTSSYQGLYVYKSANVTGGDITVEATGKAIVVNQDSTFRNCDLTITSTGDNGIATDANLTFEKDCIINVTAKRYGIYCTKLNFSNFVGKMIVKSADKTAIASTKLSMSSGTVGSMSKNMNGSSPVPFTATTDVYKYAYIRGASVYINGIGMGIGDYLAQGATAASTYRPTSGGYAHLTVNGESDELELNNFSISATGTTDGVYSTSSLKLYVSGSNSITTANGTGIRLVGGYLYVIGGEGTLNIKSTGGYGINLNNSDTSKSGGYNQMGTATIRIEANGGTGIAANKNDITVSRGELYVSSKYYAIYATNLTVSGGKADIKGTGSNCAVFVTGNFTYGSLQIKATTTANGTLGTYNSSNLRNYKRVVVASHICSGQQVAPKSATCTAEGKLSYYKCSCGKYYEDAACSTVISNLSTWGIVSALGHTVSPVWSTDGSNHWKVCTRCSAVIDNSKSPHYGGDSTCQYKAQCSVCDTFYGSFADHNWSTKWDVKTAEGHAHSCQTPGCEESSTVQKHTPGAAATEQSDQICTTCQYVIAPKLNHVHKTVKVDAEPATCHQGGNLEYWFCQSCPKFFSDAAGKNEITDINTMKLPRLQHDYAPATCTAPKTCKRSGCGATEGTPLGHLPAENYSSDATHHYKTCTRCDIAAIPETKVAHSGGNATCLDKAVCDVCSVAYGDKADHKWSDTWDFYYQEEGHCHFCTTPGCTASSEWEAHVPGPEATEDSDQVCTECGCVLAAALNHVHDYTAGIQHSENEHWSSCSCGDKANVEAHSDTDGDGLCDKCAFTLPTDTGSSDTTGNTPGNTVENTSGDSTDAVTTDENGDKNGKDNTLTVILLIIGATAVIGIVIAVVIANKKKKS